MFFGADAQSINPQMDTRVVEHLVSNAEESETIFYFTTKHTKLTKTFGNQENTRLENGVKDFLRSLIMFYRRCRF